MSKHWKFQEQYPTFLPALALFLIPAQDMPGSSLYC